MWVSLHLGRSKISIVKICVHVHMRVYIRVMSSQTRCFGSLKFWAENSARVRHFIKQVIDLVLIWVEHKLVCELWALHLTKHNIILWVTIDRLSINIILRVIIELEFVNKLGGHPTLVFISPSSSDLVSSTKMWVKDRVVNFFSPLTNFLIDSFTDILWDRLVHWIAIYIVKWLVLLFFSSFPLTLPWWSPLRDAR